MDDLMAVLSEAVEAGRPVEVLRVGTFVDMHGTEVVITEEVIDQLVANFEAGAAGQEVPLDIMHRRDEAAGWVRRVWREGERMWAEVEWNALGQKLVGDRIYRYLSATFHLAERVLKSISLVNFPAVKGLQPVALGEEQVFLYQLREFEEEAMAEEQVNVDVEALREQVRGEVLTELQERERTLAELREQVRGEVEAELRERFERRQGLIAFAEEVCNGEVGLSVPVAEVVAFLEELAPDQAAQAQALLKARVVEFGERGSAAPGAAETGEKQALPEEYAAGLRSGELTVADLRNPILELGDLGQYDLTEFEEGV